MNDLHTISPTKFAVIILGIAIVGTLLFLLFAAAWNGVRHWRNARRMEAVFLGIERQRDDATAKAIAEHRTAIARKRELRTYVASVDGTRTPE